MSSAAPLSETCRYRTHDCAFGLHAIALFVSASARHGHRARNTVFCAYLAALSGAALTGCASVLVMFIPLHSHGAFYGLPWTWALTLPLAALIYMVATIDSALRHLRGKGGNGKDGRKPHEQLSPRNPQREEGHTENFPVGSFLIRSDLRRMCMPSTSSPARPTTSATIRCLKLRIKSRG